MEQTTPSNIDAYRKTAKYAYSQEMPQDGPYHIVVAGPGIETTRVIGNIWGRYKAQHVRDFLTDEHGHAGISFSIKSVGDE